MIYITGDIHGGLDINKISNKNLKEKGIEINENDFLIIAGDFGLPFTPDDITEYESGKKCEYAFWIDWLKEKPYTVLFVDGNHDNHEWWGRQPVTEMFGGKVQIHPHAPNVIHLMRGEIYTIEDKTFFTFGGAASTDKSYRKEGYSWWKEEEASYAETENALSNLEKTGFKVDCIVTHTLPEKIISEIRLFRNKNIPCTTAMFLNEVLARVEYGKWFCGHFHADLTLCSQRIYMLYDSIINSDI